jgi:molybdate transport system substrate-binding protein
MTAERRRMPVQRCLAGLVAMLFCALATAAASAPRPVTVFAATSLTDALEQLGDDFTRSTGVKVRFSFAASSVLARQIEAGAGADMFFSADQAWMDYLQQRGRIREATRRNLVGNRLVLIAPADTTLQLKIAPGFALLSALGGGRLATGDPDSVPVGRYAKSALTSLGVWQDVEDRLVRAEDARHALMFVARGEVPLGIVYASDARIDRNVRVVDVFPAGSHRPISYPVALTRGASAEAARFLDFVQGPAGRAAFEQRGFEVLQDVSVRHIRQSLPRE